MAMTETQKQLNELRLKTSHNSRSAKQNKKSIANVLQGQEKLDEKLGDIHTDVKILTTKLVGEHGYFEKVDNLGLSVALNTAKQMRTAVILVFIGLFLGYVFTKIGDYYIEQSNRSYETTLFVRPDNDKIKYKREA